MNLKNLLDQLSILFTKLAILLGFPPDPPKIPIDHSIPPPAPTHVSSMPALAHGIFEAEGGIKAAGYSLNNPGDIKSTKYAKELGADDISRTFAHFPTMDAGIQACIQLCTDAATDKLRAYKGTMTLSDFCKIYAEPPVLKNYVNVVLKNLKGRDGMTTIRELL